MLSYAAEYPTYKGIQNQDPFVVTLRLRANRCKVFRCELVYDSEFGDFYRVLSTKFSNNNLLSNVSILQDDLGECDPENVQIKFATPLTIDSLGRVEDTDVFLQDKPAMLAQMFFYKLDDAKTPFLKVSVDVLQIFNEIPFWTSNKKHLFTVEVLVTSFKIQDLEEGEQGPTLKIINPFSVDTGFNIASEKCSSPLTVEMLRKNGWNAQFETPDRALEFLISVTGEAHMKLCRNECYMVLDETIHTSEGRWYPYSQTTVTPWKGRQDTTAITANVMLQDDHKQWLYKHLLIRLSLLSYGFDVQV